MKLQLASCGTVFSGVSTRSRNLVLSPAYFLDLPASISEGFEG